MGNSYEIVALCLFTMVYYLTSRANRTESIKLNHQAVLSASCMIFNPFVLGLISRQLHLPFAFSVGFEAGSSFLFAAAGFVLGVIAISRIQNKKDESRGIPYALIGIAGGVLCAGFWILTYLKLAAGLGNFK